MRNGAPALRKDNAAGGGGGGGAGGAPAGGAGGGDVTNQAGGSGKPDSNGGAPGAPVSDPNAPSTSEDASTTALANIAYHWVSPSGSFVPCLSPLFSRVMYDEEVRQVNESCARRETKVGWGNISQTRVMCEDFYGKVCQMGSLGPCGASNAVAYFEREALLNGCTEVCAESSPNASGATNLSSRQFSGLDPYSACRKAFCHSVNSEEFKYDAAALSSSCAQRPGSWSFCLVLLVLCRLLMSRHGL